MGTSNGSVGPQIDRRVRIALRLELHLREPLERYTDGDVAHACRTTTECLKTSDGAGIGSGVESGLSIVEGKCCNGGRDRRHRKRCDGG